MTWFWRWVRVMIVVALGAGCQSVRTTQGGVVGVDRDQSMLISAKAVEEASAKQYQQVLEGARQKSLLNRDGAKLARVRGVADRLIPQVRVFRPDAGSWHWEVNVLTSEELNAWCMAGGKIMVYSGLLDKLGLTDDELAAVLGHEIAHALREHARERVSRAMATSIGVSIVGVAVGAGSIGQDVMGKVAEVTFELPNSRLHETEADRIGVELAARAGFDPRAAVSLWEKLGRQSSGAPPEWLSTHPNHGARQQDLARYAERVMPLYEANRR